MMPLSNFSFPILTPHSLPHDNSSHIRLNGNENNFNNQTNIKPNKSIRRRHSWPSSTCVHNNDVSNENAADESSSFIIGKFIDFKDFSSILIIK